jgi:hypothetical protein
MQVYDFLGQYGSYASMFGLDYTKPMDSQLSIDGTMTWQQYFLNSALNAWTDYQAMYHEADANGFVLDQEYLDYLEKLPYTMAQSAEDMGYESAEAMLQRDMGAGATVDAYLNYLNTYYKGYMYYGECLEQIAVTDADIEAYFDAHAEEYSANGLEKTDECYVDVRHILICPKGGTTDEAGACLLSSAVRGERRIVCVVLGCDGEGNTSQTFPDSIKLYDYGFDNFSTKTILTSDEMIDEMSVKLSKQTSYVVVHPAENLEAVLPNDLSPEELTRTVTFNAEYALAPIAKGDVLGEISLSYGDHVYGSTPLLAQYDVEASKFLTAKYHLEQFLSRTVVQLSILGILILIALFVLWWKLLRPKRRYGRSAKGRRTRSYHGRRRR